MSIKIPELLALARGQACIRCRKDNGTIVPAHYTGMRQHTFGKGTGIKCADLMTAHLCLDCHHEVDSLSISTFDSHIMRKVDQSEQMLFHIAMTLLRLWQQGHIKIVT